MKLTRTFEVICGAASGILGVATLIFALFGPTYAGASTGCDSSGVCYMRTLPPTSVVQLQGLSSVLGVLIFGVLFFMLIAGGAALDGMRGVAEGRAMLWLGTVLLTVGMFLALLSIGVLFVPSWLLAVAASVLAIVRRADTAARAGN